MRQLALGSFSLQGTLVPFSSGRLRGHLFTDEGNNDEILIAPDARNVPPRYTRVVKATISEPPSKVDLTESTWLRHPLLGTAAGRNASAIEEVLTSWAGAFSYVEEVPEHGVLGLRRPQIGAIHAVHAHWAASDEPGTIVMPTGTGKTDTMLSILVSQRCQKLLVVVPTDALRTQITGKFLSLGILKAAGSKILGPGALFPIVCTLQHRPTSVAEVDAILEAAQVIVTTSSIAGQCGDAIQKRMARLCPYLFIDEAHHAEAPTWRAFRERFGACRVLQFTATPFREDGKTLDGTIVFRYPLRKAQKEGYFQEIKFHPVVEFNPRLVDQAIAEKAVAQLRRDADKGHILLARVDSVARAAQVFKLYEPYTEFNPVQLHTGITSVRQREALRRQIIAGQARIVVCVDMLGEGFDLPELKIAAFHDIRKTLAVTLQLAGRFTRTHPRLGHATFIANTADVIVQDELRKLYSRDPDWNVLLPALSDSMVGEQVTLEQFLRGFTDFTEAIPLKTVRPATSAVVYRTQCADWSPEKFEGGIPARKACEQVHHAINHAEHTLVVVTARRAQLEWTDVDSLFGWVWELYVVIWDSESKLLFINSSTNAGDYKAMANAVAGDDAVLIRGQQVFRTFAGVNRLRLQNVGLTEQLGRNVRYTGRMGSDVEPALTDLQRQRASKSVLSGSGYEGGLKTTVGASRKGRIWSHRRDRVDQLAAWCRAMGGKLLDETINPDEVLKGTLNAKSIVTRPAKMPISVGWPEEVFTEPEQLWTVVVGEEEHPLADVSLELVSPSTEGHIQLALVTDSTRVELALELFEKDETPNYRFRRTAGPRALLRKGGTGAVDAQEFFYEDPPVVWFVDGSALEGNQYIELAVTRPPYSAEKIQAWNWEGVNLRKESQGSEKAADSIQAKVIRELQKGDYRMIVDDDSKGEAADIVAIRVVGEGPTPQRIEVEFYHCKYSGASTAGRRVEDLYEVCGQTQTSISWMYSPEKMTDLFTHLMRREASRLASGGPTRYELGDGEDLQTIREMSRLCSVSLKILVVQPGLSKAAATPDQLELLSVTENYLWETFQIPFGVIASA